MYFLIQIDHAIQKINIAFQSSATIIINSELYALTTIMYKQEENSEISGNLNFSFCDISGTL